MRYKDFIRFVPIKKSCFLKKIKTKIDCYNFLLNLYANGKSIHQRKEFVYNTELEDNVCDLIWEAFIQTNINKLI